MLNISSHALAHFDTPESLTTPHSPTVSEFVSNKDNYWSGQNQEKEMWVKRDLAYSGSLYWSDHHGSKVQSRLFGEKSLNPHCTWNVVLVWVSGCICTSIINIHYSIFLLFPSGVLGFLFTHLQVPHLFCSVYLIVCVCVCAWEHACASMCYLWVCMYNPRGVFIIYFFK